MMSTVKSELAAGGSKWCQLFRVNWLLVAADDVNCSE